MASLLSSISKLCLRFITKPAMSPALSISKLRRIDAKNPYGFLIRGCTIEKKLIKNVNITILTPRKKTSDGILMFMHGGAYVSGPAMPHWIFLAKLCSDTGKTAVLIDYRKAPEFSYPCSMDDVLSVYEYLQEKNDSHKIIFLGDSAGGGLALAAVFKLREEKKPMPQKLVLLSPWLDITMTNPEISEIEKKDYVLAREGLIQAGRIYAGNLDASHYLLSPINGDPAGIPPVLLFVGTDDILAADCRKFRKIAEKARVPLQYEEWDKMFHDWMLLTPFFREANEAGKKIVRFIELD